MASYRRITTADHALIEEVSRRYFPRITEKAKKEWLYDVDLDVALHYILHEADHAHIVDENYLVVFDIGDSWFSSKVMLMEQLVLSLRPGSPFSVVTDFLEEQAHLLGCNLISVGTSMATSDRALARIYTGQGYRQEAIALTKRIANVQLIAGQEQGP